MITRRLLCLVQFAQVALAMVKPQAHSPWRWTWNLVHINNARLAIVLAWVNISLGFVCWRTVNGIPSYNHWVPGVASKRKHCSIVAGAGGITFATCVHICNQSQFTRIASHAMLAQNGSMYALTSRADYHCCLVVWSRRWHTGGKPVQLHVHGR